MSEPTTRQLLSTHELASAAFDYGAACAALHATPGERIAAQQRLRPLLLASMSDPLPRARDIAARVHDLDALNLAHPGMWSQEQVSVERERIVGEIRRLMGGVR